jgi:hypothetical protein
MDDELFWVLTSISLIEDDTTKQKNPKTQPVLPVRAKSFIKRNVSH